MHLLYIIFPEILFTELFPLKIPKNQNTTEGLRRGVVGRGDVLVIFRLNNEFVLLHPIKCPQNNQSTLRNA